MKRLIIGISGASGVIYGVRLLEVLRGVAGIETHVVLSPAARRTLALETDLTVEDIHAIANAVYQPGDIAAAISSGSFRASGMIIAPCSIKTVSGIATSYSDNLLLRAADVTLKERRPLVLLVRETPLHLGHLRLLQQVAELGAIVMPPVPAFYHRPGKLEEVIDQTVNRALDMLGIELDQDLFPRWQGPAATWARKSADLAPTADPAPIQSHCSSPPMRPASTPGCSRLRGMRSSRSRPVREPDMSGSRTCQDAGEPVLHRAFQYWKDVDTHLGEQVEKAVRARQS